MDVALREAERLFVTDPSYTNQTLLDAARKRAGYVQRYVACKRCDPETKCVRSHGRAMLCDECGGQGWTNIVWVLEV